MPFPLVNFKSEGHGEENNPDVYKEDGEYEVRVPNLNASFFFLYLSLKPQELQENRIRNET